MFRCTKVNDNMPMFKHGMSYPTIKRGDDTFVMTGVFEVRVRNVTGLEWTNNSTDVSFVDIGSDFKGN